MLCADEAPIHRRKHLDVRERIKAETLRHSVRDEFNDLMHDLLRIFPLDKVEVLEPSGTGFSEEWGQPAVHPVRIGDDQAVFSLSKNIFQNHDGTDAGFDDIFKHMPRADRRQLVNVPDQDQCGF